MKPSTIQQIFVNKANQSLITDNRPKEADFSQTAAYTQYLLDRQQVPLPGEAGALCSMIQGEDTFMH